MLALDLIQTLAFAGVALFVGYSAKRAIAPLSRYNVPAPAVGGLLVAGLLTAARAGGYTPLQFDTTLQTPLMVAFFTSIGFGASLGLLRRGGPAVLLFLALSTAAAVAQNVLGAGVALLLGQHPLMGVLAGSVTLTGGPATGLAFAPLFEQAGVPAAATVAVAVALGGIVCGGLLGGPLGTLLVERRSLRPSDPTAARTGSLEPAELMEFKEPEAAAPVGEDSGAYALLKAVVAMLVAMAVGAWLSKGLAASGLTLPAYIGAMLVAAVLRNLDDRTRWPGLSQRLIDDLGNAALALFLVMALMTLKLWELASLALPLLVILFAQVALVALLCLTVVPKVMGRDYDAAVMSSGFCGFMLGTTANAMANMSALVERYGPAPRAFLVVPMVGAFFIDFVNAVLITSFLNFWR